MTTEYVPEIRRPRVGAALYGAAKAVLKRRLSPSTYARLRRGSAALAGAFVRANLPALASLHGTDKWNHHWYAQHYQRHFEPLRKKRINLLEIGIGGYDDPNAGGQSLRMWKQFFPQGRIFGLDIYDKSALAEPRISILQGSQSDRDFLKDVVRRIGRIDIVVDDGSHINEHVITTFETLFPLLPPGSIYAIEDMQTSYWPGPYGGSEDPASSSTTMGRIKRLVDGLNYREFVGVDYVPGYFDKHVISVHFYHNLAFIYKGFNDEPSTRHVASDVGSQATVAETNIEL